MISHITRNVQLIEKAYTSNKKVATVSKSGKIKAKRKGKCTITITAKNGKKTKIKVRVK